MKKCGIYKITCINNKKIYIGSSNNIKQRWASHRSRLRLARNCNINLLNSYKKYGLKSLLFEIIEICRENKLIERETFWVNEYKQNKIVLFNCGEIIENPTRGTKLTEEHKKKVSIGLKKFYKNGGITPNKGKKSSKLVCEKISNALKKQYESGIRKMSDDNKAKLIAIAKLPKSDEHKKNLSEAKIKAVGVKIICIDTGDNFQSLTQAAKYFNTSYQAIRQSIIRNGKCKGLQFQINN